MKIQPRKVALALLMILLLACAACAMKFSKPGLTREQWNKDDYECRRDNQTLSGYGGFYGGYVDTSVDWGMYSRCMRARGYTREN